jgi:hypothetical protein
MTHPHEDECEKINEYYRQHPPAIILDDLGIHHEVEVPIPAKYIKRKCQCGIIHKWEYPYTFFLDELYLMKGLQPKIIKKCSICLEILILELYKNSTHPG